MIEKPTSNRPSRRSASPRSSECRPARLSRAAGLLAAVVPAIGVAGAARAGAVLVSRDSYIHAAGGPAGTAAFAPFDVSNGTTGFDRFADDVSNAGQGADPVVSEAHQYSAPGVMPDGLNGAFAEGSVRSGLDAGRGTASAASDFDLTFRVVGGSAKFEFGAAMGTAGGGRVTAELLPVSESQVAGTLSPSAASAALAPLFVTHLAPGEGNSKEMDNTGVLEPGLYALHVSAESDGAAADAGAESSAYYSVNLTLAPTAGGPAAVPLPPAVWPGFGAMASILGVFGIRRWRRGVGSTE